MPKTLFPLSAISKRHVSHDKRLKYQTKIIIISIIVIFAAKFIGSTLTLSQNEAYEIMKNKEGYYVVIYFKAETSFITELERYQSDLVICNIKKDITGNKNDAQKMLEKKKAIYSSKDEVLECIHPLMQQEIFNAVCNKIYVLGYIRKGKISFNKDLDMGEDLQVNLSYIQYVNNLVITNDLWFNL